MTRARVAAFAKVNLSLEVLGKHPDGFHEVRTVMQSISLSDHLEVEQTETFSLECDDPALEGEDNLVLRAARALRDAAPGAGGARMVLRKGIPTAAGLGGASADAAAALVALERLWNGAAAGERKVSPSPCGGGGGGRGSLPATLGSDVPFFLQGGTALATGRGETVEPLPDVVPFWLVLFVPPHSLEAKTAHMYRLLSPEQWTTGETTARLAERISHGGPVEDDLLCNAFEAVADLAFPALPEYRAAMQRAGARRAHLSGAGPALFALFESEAEAQSIATRLSDMGYRPSVARSLSAAEAQPSVLVD